MALRDRFRHHDYKWGTVRVSDRYVVQEHHPMRGCVVSVVVVVITGGAAAAERQTAATAAAIRPSARAQLTDPEGRSVGEAVLRESPHGVLVSLRLTKVAPGIHAVHIHEVGRCERPTFESAGGHFNPTKREHGFLNPRGVHAGDLPNIEIPTDLRYSAEYFVDGVSLAAGPQSLMDADGSAVVIHQGRDDYVTDPAGDAGARVACGQIVQ
jgi:Cu-Zn family superoxide dismutase